MHISTSYLTEEIDLKSSYRMHYNLTDIHDSLRLTFKERFLKDLSCNGINQWFILFDSPTGKDPVTA